MLEDEANTLSRNVGSRLPNAAASHPERTEFLATSPWKPQIRDTDVLKTSDITKKCSKKEDSSKGS